MPEDQGQDTAAQEAAEQAAKEAEAARAAAAASDAEEAFDKDRALETIRKQRESEKAAVDRAKALEAKVREYEDKDKTEAQKLSDAKDAAAAEAAEAKAETIRLRMAMKYGLDEEDLDLLGTGDEETIEARAKRLSERTQPNEDDARRRPRERLKPGARPNTEADDVQPGLGRLVRAYAQE